MLREQLHCCFVFVLFIKGICLTETVRGRKGTIEILVIEEVEKSQSWELADQSSSWPEQLPEYNYKRKEHLGPGLAIIINHEK